MSKRKIQKVEKSTKPKQDTLCYKYSWRSHKVEDRMIWTEWCRRWGKEWSFQREKGEETGKEHFQGYISLKVKKRPGEIKKQMLATDRLPEYFEPLSKNCENFANLYVTKEDTRIEGPWNDKDDAKDNVYVPPQYMLPTPYDWQKQIMESCKVGEERFVNILYDPRGARGKTTVAGHLDVLNKAVWLPSVNNAKDLVAACCNILMSTNNHDPGGIVLNLTRSQNQKNLFEMYDAIETIKDGRVYDMRYKFTRWYFKAATLWVFCNTLPDFKMLSMDRWKVWVITNEGTLKPYDWRLSWAAEMAKHTKEI